MASPFLVNRVVRFIPPALPRRGAQTVQEVEEEFYRYADELHRHLRMAFEALNLDNNLADLIAMAEEEGVPLEITNAEIQKIESLDEIKLLLTRILCVLQVAFDDECDPEASMGWGEGEGA